MPKRSSAPSYAYIDAAWKALIRKDFFSFLAFFYAEFYQEVDRSKPPEFLEKELHSVLKNRALKIMDTLVLVHLLSGERRWVSVHIEIESYPEKMPERMFQYFYLLFDYNKMLATKAKKKLKTPIETPTPALETNTAQPTHPPENLLPHHPRDITALVIYAGKDVERVYDRYEYEAYGTSLVYRFNTYQVREQKEEELLANPSPFAVAVLANLYLLRTSGKDTSAEQKRLLLKKEVYRLAAMRQYDDDLAAGIFSFIEELLRLPKPLEEEFFNFANNTPDPDPMTHITYRTRNLADAIAISAFGESYTTVKKEALQKDAIISQKDAALSETKAALSQKDAVITKSIIGLFTNKSMTISEIAELLTLSPEYISEVLAAHNLLP